MDMGCESTRIIIKKSPRKFQSSFDEKYEFQFVKLIF